MWVSRIGESSAPSDQRRERERGKRDAREGGREGGTALAHGESHSADRDRKVKGDE